MFKQFKFQNVLPHTKYDPGGPDKTYPKTVARIRSVPKDIKDFENQTPFNPYPEIKVKLTFHNADDPKHPIIVNRPIPLNIDGFPLKNFDPSDYIDD